MAVCRGGGSRAKRSCAADRRTSRSGCVPVRLRAGFACAEAVGAPGFQAGPLGGGPPVGAELLTADCERLGPAGGRVLPGLLPAVQAAPGGAPDPPARAGRASFPPSPAVPCAPSTPAKGIHDLQAGRRCNSAVSDHGVTDDGRGPPPQHERPAARRWRARMPHPAGAWPGSRSPRSSVSRPRMSPARPASERMARRVPAT
jgi:hypothetical protein